LSVIVYPTVACQWRQYSRHTWRAKSCLYRYDQKWYFFKSLFIHLRLILLCQILWTPLKLTEKYRTVNTNSSFSLTQLLTMFYGALGLLLLFIGTQCICIINGSVLHLWYLDTTLH